MKHSIIKTIFKNIIESQMMHCKNKKLLLQQTIYGEIVSYGNEMKETYGHKVYDLKIECYSILYECWKCIYELF